MRYFFLLLLFLCVWLGGMSFCLKYRKRVKYFESFLNFLHFSKCEVKYSSATVYAIIEKFQALQGQSWSLFEGCREPVAPAIAQNLEKDKLLEPSQKELLLAFFERFGTADEDGSLHLIEEYREKSLPVLTSLKEESRKKMQLIAKLSFLAAAGISIILL